MSMHRLGRITGPLRFVSDGRARFRTSSKSTNRDDGHDVRAPRPTCTSETKGHFMTPGTINFYNDTKGFGFIQPDDGQKDVLVHATALERAGINSLREGQKVNFDTRNDPR